MKTSFFGSILLGDTLLAAAMLGSGEVKASPGHQAQEKPNIVFILADDLGWKDVGYAGSSFYRTPHIDRLAKEGMQFSRAYSAACVCSPSRGAIFSGKNPARTGLTTVWSGGEGPDDRLFNRSKDQGGVNQYLEALHRHALPRNETTFAEVLGEAGYITGFWGKWHLGEFSGYQPCDRGFQVAQGYRHEKSGGSTRGHWGKSYPPKMLVNLPGLQPDDYIADVLTSEAVKFIRDNKSKPFLAVISHYLVHNPIQPKPELVSSYNRKPNTDQNNAEYAAMIESFDQSIGQILKTLDDYGLTENTLVVVTSDNGGLTLRNTSNYPLMGGKSFPFEAGMRVPLVMRWPAAVKPGATCQQRVTGMDFYPTFLSAAGLPLLPLQHVDGINLMPAMTSGEKLAERPLVFHYPHYTHATGPNSVLVENDWKLIRFYNDETGRYLLYNLAADPFEQHDLSARLQGKVKRLDKRLTQLLQDMKAQMPVKNPAFQPNANDLLNRQFTLDLATRERQMFAEQLKEDGSGLPPNGHSGKSEWTFVSMPDFLNVDCDYPQEGWEDALSWILKAVKKENPDFLIVAGDLVMGEWDGPGWNDKDSIVKYANRYYPAWINRMNDHGLKFYTSLGDHEIGDNDWPNQKKLDAVKIYKEEFARHLKMPRNGPDAMKGTAFWWRHKNVLFISTDVFETGNSRHGLIKPGVSGDQLNWMKKILKENADADFKIVLGHVPVLGPVRKWSSSAMIIQEGRDSEFWQTMKEHNVDAYLCGEVHAITCTERDGIMQVAHGGLVGYNTRTNYMVMRVSDNKIEFEIREIKMLPQGEHLWQVGQNRPLAKVTISEEDKFRGFYTVGVATLDKSAGKQFINRKGYFLTKYETSNETAVPVFRKINKQGYPTELPVILLEND